MLLLCSRKCSTVVFTTAVHLDQQLQPLLGWGDHLTMFGKRPYCYQTLNMLPTGVELMPFHAKSTSLPDLTAAQWDSLMQCSMASQDSQRNVAAVLLSVPHFTQVTSCSPNTSFIAHGCSASATHIFNSSHTWPFAVHSLCRRQNNLTRDGRILELDAGVFSG